MVIRSFGSTMTERLWLREHTKELDPRIERISWMPPRPSMTFGSPPGNRLETLRDNPTGQQSIRVDQQWRVCFTWTPAGPESVEIVDCH